MAEITTAARNAATADPVREAKKLRRALVKLTDAVLVYLAGLDELAAKRRDVPSDVSAWLGANATTLDMANDMARYFVLDVSYRTDDKTRAVAAARKRMGFAPRRLGKAPSRNLGVRSVPEAPTENRT